jgi:hypothetical protein
MTTFLLRIAALSLLVLGMVVSPARADDTADAKAFITKQVAQIKAGDTAGLKAGFTARLQPKITAEAVAKAAKQVGSITIDELVSSVVAEGKDSLKIKMKNGRSLTTLVKVDGKWAADTVWFK